MNAQEIFDTVVTHLRAQGCKSKGPIKGQVTACAYRGDNGLKCAVGILIPDEDYKAEWEGESPNPSEFRFTPLSKAAREFKDYCIAKFGEDNLELLAALQETHDYNEVEHWEQRFERISYNYGLTIPAKTS